MSCDFRKVQALKRFTKIVESVANGNAAHIIREGIIWLSDTLNLDIVLLVPSLDYDLLYAAQIIVVFTLSGDVLPLFLCF